MPVRAAASVSLGHATSTESNWGGNDAGAGAGSRITSVSCSRASSIVLRTVSRGISNCKRSTSASAINLVAACTSAVVSRPLAPGMTVIAFSPLPSTATIARPLAQFGVTAIRLTSIPSASKPPRSRSPKPSSPTRPIMATSAPSRAAATARLAPLPPASSYVSRPIIVSPGRGSRDERTTRSRLIEPATTIRGRPECESELTEAIFHRLA